MQGSARRLDIAQLVAGGAGLAVLAALWLSPLVPMSRTAFSPHMLLHLGITVVAAPLLGLALARRLPAPGRFGEALRWYLLAAAFETLTVWGWHVPLLHDAAGQVAAVFIVEQASFLAGGIALWGAVWSARKGGATAAAALVLFLTFTHMSMFGLVLTLAPRLIYDPNLCQGAFGFGRLDDQHFGGALMTLAALPYLVVATLMAARLIAPRRAEAKTSSVTG